MKARNLTVIVAGLRPRIGTTLLTRVLADYFILSHEEPLIFDTDSVDRRLSAYFPHLVTPVDLERVQGQMVLFDTMASALPEKRLVDVTHRGFRKFFDLMQQIDYLEEARLNHVESVIFYIVGRDSESHDQGAILRQRFDCPFVVVENPFVGEPRRDARFSSGYAMLNTHPLRMRMADLDPLLVDIVADPRLSITGFMRQDTETLPLAFLSRECRSAVRAWVMKMFREIHSITHALAALAREPADHVPGR